MRWIRELIIGVIAVFVIFGFVDVDTKRIKDVTSVIDNVFEDSKVNKLEKDEVVVSRVVDGDTLITLDADGKEERVRLLLIDTPESVHPTKPVEAFGKEASDFAKQYMKNGKKFVLEKGNPERDRYDRLLAYLWVDGVNFNKLMLEKGYARVAYVYEPNTKYLDEFEKAEQKAKKQKLGVWSISNYVTEKGFDMSVVK